MNLSSFPFLKGSPSIKQIVDRVFPSQVDTFFLTSSRLSFVFFVKRALNLSKYFLLPRSAYFILDFTFRRNYVFIEMIQGTQMIFIISHTTLFPFAFAPMVLEIIIEYWSFMIFYFMLLSCRLSFQKIEILVIQIVCCHNCTQNST